jgi:hypothetical protein
MAQATIASQRRAAWTELTSHATRLSSVPNRELFAHDPVATSASPARRSVTSWILLGSVLEEFRVHPDYPIDM